MSSIQLARHWDAIFAEGDERRSWAELDPRHSLEAIERVSPPPEAAIIDVGGGSSRLADRLLAAGHRDLTVLDISAAALELARDRLGQRANAIEWITADVLSWRPEREYALWHDRAVLHFFTDPDDAVRYRDTLRAALAPNGHAIIATFAPDGPNRCSGLPVRRSSAEQILSLLGAGFELEHAGTRVHRTPAGVRQPFTWTTARRTD